MKFTSTKTEEKIEEEAAANLPAEKSETALALPKGIEKQFQIVAKGQGQIQKTLIENLGTTQITVSDLERIKVPAGTLIRSRSKCRPAL